MHPRAGQKPLAEDLVDLSELTTAYYDRRPDPADPAQRVAFGTSGHRGSSLDGTFNEQHILATTQAIVDHRRAKGVTGPILVGRDTHALSEPAWISVLEVLVGNGVEVLIDAQDGFTPTPALSRAVLQINREAGAAAVDGILITPSHNPPRDGGLKYNPPTGGPADTDDTGAIAALANALLERGLDGVKRASADRARATAGRYDFKRTYIDDLASVLDLQAIKQAGVKIAADPLGGASVDYWADIAETYGLDLTVTNPSVDPRWSFMPLDHDGKIRMDCSSPPAMRGVLDFLKASPQFHLATGNDADADRHGIVTPDGGLMNPNHFLAVAISYLFCNRSGWSPSLAIGKTLVSSSMIDRVAAGLGRKLFETPVGFKYFVPGLLAGDIGFGGEESAGASFLRKDGSAWTTDKDGLLLALLAAEICAVEGKSPSELYSGLTELHGTPTYARIDAPANREQKQKLGALNASAVTASELAGEPIEQVLTHAPGNGAAIGGLKIVTANAWFAARPSGTEDVYKVYAESFLGEDHLKLVQDEARKVVSAALA